MSERASSENEIAQSSDVNEQRPIATSVEVIDSQTDEYEGQYDLKMTVDHETFYLTIGHGGSMDFKAALESVKRGGTYTPETGEQPRSVESDGDTRSEQPECPECGHPKRVVPDPREDDNEVMCTSCGHRYERFSDGTTGPKDTDTGQSGGGGRV